jgi:phosphatidylglycerol---prolipoprotein diacylglyceryl transferase
VALRGGEPYADDRRLRFAPVAMQPELDIGPITLQTFGIMFALAFIAAGAVVAKRLSELGKPPDWAYEMVFAALIGGIVGARLDFIIQNWADVADDPIGNIFSGTGLVWFGGMVGGAIGVVIWARFRGMLNLRLLDVAAPALALGYAVGRIGCQVSGDGDYGIPWDGPWAMAYPDGTVPTDVPVHPTPIYETLAMCLVAYALWRLRFSFRPGLLFALYLILSGIERFLVEFIRRNDEVFVGLTLPQVLSAGLIVAGAVWIGVKWRRGELLAAPHEAARRSARA